MTGCVGRSLFKHTAGFKRCSSPLKIFIRADKTWKSHNNKTFSSGSLSDPVDLSGHVRRRGRGLSLSGHPRRDQPLSGGYHQHSHRHRTDPHDVPPLGQGEIREDGACLQERQGAGPLPCSELGDRPDPHVPAGHRLPLGAPRIHGGAHPDRSCPVHRHGHRLERSGRQGTGSTVPGWWPSTPSFR